MFINSDAQVENLFVSDFINMVKNSCAVYQNVRLSFVCDFEYAARDTIYCKYASAADFIIFTDCVKDYVERDNTVLVYAEHFINGEFVYTVYIVNEE